LNSGEHPFDYRKLDKVLHSRIRLAVMGVLVKVEEMDFSGIREAVGATDGNLNTHLKTLREAEYVAERKIFIDRKPATFYRLTEEGREALHRYVEQLERFISE
jgi:DNA-binding transcriptional ArsR family regulator